MFTIIQKPNAINYSLSLPDIKLSSDKVAISAELLEDDRVILEEQYDIPPSGLDLVIKLSSLLHEILTVDMPDYNENITVHPDIRQFVVKLFDDEDIAFINFKIIKGFARRQPFNIEGFFRDNWLNLVPNVSEVHYHQPLYLTALPQKSVTVCANVRMVDETNKVVTLGAMVANKLQSVNLNPGKMINTFGGPYKYFDIYTQDSEGIIQNGLKRFFFTEKFDFNADTFFYANRLGGWDTLTLIGEHRDNSSNTISSALFDDIEHEYGNAPRMEIEKNGGFITSEEHRRQCIDFLYSKNRYHLHQGSLLPIVLTNPILENVRGELNSFSFTFRHSDTMIAYPEIGISTYQLIF